MVQEKRQAAKVVARCTPAGTGTPAVQAGKQSRRSWRGATQHRHSTQRWLAGCDSTPAVLAIASSCDGSIGVSPGQRSKKYKKQQTGPCRACMLTMLQPPSRESGPKKDPSLCFPANCFSEEIYKKKSPPATSLRGSDRWRLHAERKVLGGVLGYSDINKKINYRIKK